MRRLIGRTVHAGKIKAITPCVAMMAVSCSNITGGNAVLVMHAAHDLMGRFIYTTLCQTAEIHKSSDSNSEYILMCRASPPLCMAAAELI